LPHHLPEEMRRLDAEEDEVLDDGDVAAPDDDDARLVLLQTLVGEGAEVVAPDQARGGVAHRVRVEAVLDPPDERLRERRAARGSRSSESPRIRWSACKSACAPHHGKR